MAQAPFAFARPGLDRAAETREDAAALDALRADPAARLVLVRRDGRALVDGATARLARLALDAVDPASDLSFLGLEDGAPRFALALDAGAGPPAAAGSSARFVDLRRIAAELDAGDAGLAAYARALAQWQWRKRYCGVCGAPTTFAAAGHRAQCSDTACAQVYFPRTDPAIIVLVADGDRCLLGRQPSWPARRYSTIAGFVEPGESLEQAVAREVDEETGIRVHACRYLASQPWPFPASLMLGFVAEAAHAPVRLGSELAEACWFEAAAMPAAIAAGELVLSPRLSIAFHLIDTWYHALTGAHLEPGPAFAPR